MTIRTKSFSDLVNGFATAAQAVSTPLLDFSEGAIMLAAAEACAQVALWLQGLLLALLAQSRASTSTGADLDSWMADFGLVRAPATAAHGNATFSRKSTTGTATVAVGSTIESFDGSQAYVVTADPANSAWDGAHNGYTMGAGTGSVVVPVTALVAGAAGNARVGAVSVINSAIPGVDAVTNATAFVGGADQETDAAFRVRFTGYITTLSRATPAAIRNAVAQTTGVTTYSLTENKNTDGTTHNGFFYIVIDDGSGAPSTALVNQVTAAVELVRPAGVTFTVIKPTKVAANIAIKITAGTGYGVAAMQTVVRTALTAYINALGVGASLNWSRLAQVAYDASPGVVNVQNLTINTATADLAATANQVIRAGTVVVTH